MESYNSKELAFFSILETAINFNLIDEKSNFVLGFDELIEKISMDKVEIISNIKRLEKANFLKIKKINDDDMVLDISGASNKLSEVFTAEEIDKILLESENFIEKHDEFLVYNDIVKKYAQKTKIKLKNGISADLNEIIKEGIEELFENESILHIEKKLYALCEDVNREDYEVIKIILFCFYNFSKQENPFLVTLFLASIYKDMS